MSKDFVRPSKPVVQAAQPVVAIETIGASAARSVAASPIQRLDDGEAMGTESSGLPPTAHSFRKLAITPHAAAQQGTSGAGGPLPFLSRLQRLFGKHDLSAVVAHSDAAAAGAARSLGALAFTTGNHVAFGKTPSLHTVAHEAAHVVQQRQGVQLKGGVGSRNDPYEQHADAVAERVVHSRSAEDLLDRHDDSAGTLSRAAGMPHKPTPAIGAELQLLEDKDLKTFLEYVQQRMKSSPITNGINRLFVQQRAMEIGAQAKSVESAKQDWEVVYVEENKAYAPAPSASPLSHGNAPVDVQAPVTPPLSPSHTQVDVKKPVASPLNQGSFLDDLKARGQSSLRSAPAQVKNYGGTTIGVEQEMTGNKIEIEDKNRGVIGVVSKDGEVLVEFTTDMGGEGSYTIELRTTPCEMSALASLASRKKATEIMVNAIEAAGRDDKDHKRGPVETQTKDGFQINILKKNHMIKLANLSGFADQLSMGVQTSAMAAGSEHGTLLLGHARWYKAARVQEYKNTDSKEAAQAAKIFGMLASVIDFLGEILEGLGKTSLNEHGKVKANIADPAIKDKWEVLPRTPPWQWLDCLTEPDKKEVIAQLTARYNSASPFVQAAYGYINTGSMLAGHAVPAATIDNKHSSVFEFRRVPKSLSSYLYEEKRPEVSQQAAIPQNLLALMMQGMGKRQASSDSDSDHD